MWRKFVLNSLYFSGLQSAVTPYTGGQGSILMLHHVQNVKKTDFSPNMHLSASPEFLDRMILRLKTEGYDFISMDEVAERLKKPEAYKDAKPFLSITLDDGYRDNLINDMEHIIGAQKRVIVDFPEERREYDTSTTAKKYAAYKLLVEHLLFDTDQYVQREIVAKLCKAYGFDCEEHVQESVMNWDEVISLSKDREFDLAKELGFETATTTRHGVIYPEHKDHMTALPRVSLNGHHQSMRYVNTLLSGIPTRFKNMGKKLDVA